MQHCSYLGDWRGLARMLRDSCANVKGISYVYTSFQSTPPSDGIGVRDLGSAIKPALEKIFFPLNH